MAAHTNTIDVGKYIAIANMLGVHAKVNDTPCYEPNIYWFKAEVKRVVARGSASITVRLFFGKNDRDNRVDWVLTDDMFCTSFEVSSGKIKHSTDNKLSAYGWRFCNKTMRQKEHVRKLTVDELKDFVRTVEGKRDLAFAEFTYSHLLHRFWEASSTHESGKRSQMVAVMETQTQVPDADMLPSDDADGPAAKQVTAVGRKRKPDGPDLMEAFREMKRSINAKFFTLEEQFNSLKNMYADCQSKLDATLANKETTSIKVVKAVKHNVLDYVTPDELSPADCARLKIQDKLLTGNVTTFVRTLTDETTGEPKKHRIVRCIRQLKECPDGKGPACLSRKMDESVGHYINHDADMLPVAIMEIEPELCNMSLVDATRRWKYYSVCKACANNTSLKYIPAGKYLDLAKLEHSPRIAECVWDTCVLCMERKKKQVYENIPLCEQCYNIALKDGNVDGGDNRMVFMVPITYRFPWIKFVAQDWGQLCALKKEKQTFEGPDCMFRVEVPMLGYNIWIINEEDGGKGHSSYKVEDESTRQEQMIAITTKSPKDVVLLARTDPKAEFRTPGGRVYKPSFAVRMLVLRSWITWYIKTILSGKAVPRAIVLYMFYSHDNKHYLEAKKLAKKSKGRGKVLVGYTHTYPQQSLEIRDWRYCLTPNEGVLYQALTHNWQTNGLVKAPISNTFPDGGF